MKDFKFKIRGNTYNVEIIDVEKNIAKIEVNGTPYVVEIENEIKTSKTPTLVRKKPKLEKPKKPESASKLSQIKAPLPGNILEIKVKVGDEVNKGDTLLVMEAMKMENNILADTNGKVSKILVNTGDAVLQNDLLIELS